ncbi:MAG: hypothetical protein NT027_03980 [Proteobacteria bacterium]|nr:hypothetical protein [Pseudomonadota bacterium]
MKDDISAVGPTLKVVYEGDTVKVDASASMIDNENGGNAALEKPTKINTTTNIQGVVTRNGESSIVKLDVLSSSVDAEASSGLKSSLTAKINWDKSIGDFGLGLGLNYITRESYAGTFLSDRNTPKSDQGLSATLKWALPFNISLTGGISYSQLADIEYEMKNDSGSIVIPSTASLLAYNLLVSAPVFGTYGGIDAAYRYSDRSISPGEGPDEATKVALLKSFWSQNTTTSFKVTLKYPF